MTFIKKPALFTAVILFVSLSFPLIARAERLIDYVNPLVGTGGEGFGIGSAYPGPSTPFGMIHPGPDSTNIDSAPGFYHCSGYYYKDKHIRGFSHTRLHGIGVPDLGNVMLMPTIGKPEDMTVEKNFRSKFSHKNETSKVGYYSVLLESTGIRAEMTTGVYAAHHRYTFPASAQSLIVVDASHFIGEKVPVEADVHVDAKKGEVTGWVWMKGSMSGRNRGVRTYFLIQVKTPFESFGTWREKDYQAGRPDAHGEHAGAVLSFNTKENEVIESKVAVSFISVDQARENMKADVPGWNFDALRARTENQWEKMLSRIRVEGGTDEQKRRFYTALYQTMLLPTQYSEAGGRFIGFDLKTHTAQGFRYYSDFSMWDTYRTENPFLAVFAPDYARDMMRSLLKIYEYGGYIPKWPFATSYTNCMIGTPADIVIADTWLKGVKDFDIRLAYKGVRDTAMKPTPPGALYGGRGGIEDYIKFGYLPADRHGGSVSETLEYAYNDYALGRLARALGYKDDAKMFFDRSKSYRNLWNPEVGFMDGRKADGSFVKPFVATAWKDIYTEGDAWQWTFHVQHDVPGLMALLGGPDEFVKKLDVFFGMTHKLPRTLMPDQYFWPGNEPDIHAPYLYDWAGRPDRTAEEVRWIMAKRFPLDATGIPGNDDGGTMSAWYIFSALGFFPFPATNRYAIGTPIFDRVAMKYAGKDLVIKAVGVSDTNIYVQKVTFNGKPVETPFLNHEDLARGGTLEFVMGPAPGNWGREVVKE